MLEMFVIPFAAKCTTNKTLGSLAVQRKQLFHFSQWMTSCPSYQFDDVLMESLTKIFSLLQN